MRNDDHLMPKRLQFFGVGLHRCAVQDEFLFVKRYGIVGIVTEYQRIFDEIDGSTFRDGGMVFEKLVRENQGRAGHGMDRLFSRFGVRQAGGLAELEIGIESRGGERTDGREIDRTIGGEMFLGELDQSDFTDDEDGIVRGDRDGLYEVEGEAEPGFRDKGCGDSGFEERSQAGGGEFRNISWIAGGAMMSLFEDIGVDVIDRVGSGIEDIGQGMSIHQIRARDQADQCGVRTEMGDCGKRGEIGLPGTVDRSDQGNGFRTG